MKLLMISTDRKIFEKGSAVAQRQIEYAKKYEEVHIIIFSDKTFSESVIGSNIWVYPTRSLFKLLYIFDALKLGKFIMKNKKVDYITCQDPFETGLVGALLKKKDARLELQVHTDIGSQYFQKNNRIRTFISRYTLKKADHIRVVSDRIKKYLGGGENIEVRPIAVDIEKIKNAPIVADLHKKYPQFSKIILMASRLEKEKNIGTALEAFKIVLQKLPVAGLVIVGSGREKGELEENAVKLGIKNSVIFEGWQDDMASYYKTCDCFLVTSLYEGYGMTLVEARAAGAKVVSTDVGVAREAGAEIVEHTTKGISNGIIHTIS